MRSIGVAFGILAVFLAPMAVPAPGWAQAPGAPGAPLPPPVAGSPVEPDGGGAGLALVLLTLGFIVVIGAAGKLVDLRRRREEDAVYLESQISDVLLRDPKLFRLPIKSTVRLPTWKGSPAAITVSGQVPTPELRQVILRTVEEEASRIRSDFRIEDRIVVASRGTRAA